MLGHRVRSAAQPHVEVRQRGPHGLLIRVDLQEIIQNSGGFVAVARAFLRPRDQNDRLRVARSGFLILREGPNRLGPLLLLEIAAAQQEIRVRIGGRRTLQQGNRGMAIAAAVKSRSSLKRRVVVLRQASACQDDRQCNL